MQSLPFNFGQQFPLMNLQNNVGLLTMPNSFYPAFTLGIANFDTPNFGALMPEPEPEILPVVDPIPQAQNAVFYDPLTCAVTGYMCGDPALGLDGLLKGSFSDVIKKFGVMFLALALVIVGLYFLAQSTKTGGAVINLAGKI